MNSTLFKNFAAFAGSLIIVSAFYAAPSSAADSGGSPAPALSDTYLAAIKAATESISAKTQSILVQLNGLPAYIDEMYKLALNLKAADTTTETSQLQAQFAITGATIVKDMDGQKELQKQLDANIFGIGKTNADIPDAGGLLYSSMLGMNANLPPKQGELASTLTVPDAALMYVKRASGYSIKHTRPTGFASDPTRFINYLNTVIPAESYGAYILANQMSTSTLNDAQKSLVRQVTDSQGWLSKIAAEEIGIVLRQILLFESQNYVLMTQLVQAQKQMLAAQVMTNGILIAGFQETEKKLLDDAKQATVASNG